MVNSVDFNTIVLTKNELKCLKLLNKNSPQLIENDILLSLSAYSLIEQCISGRDDYGSPVTDGKCVINDRGTRYLIYLKQIKSPSKVEWIRYGITTTIAIAALILSIVC